MKEPGVAALENGGTGVTASSPSGCTELAMYSKRLFTDTFLPSVARIKIHSSMLLGLKRPMKYRPCASGGPTEMELPGGAPFVSQSIWSKSVKVGSLPSFSYIWTGGKATGTVVLVA